MTRSSTILRVVLAAAVVVCPSTLSASSGSTVSIAEPSTSSGQSSTPGAAQPPSTLREPQGRPELSRGETGAEQSPQPKSAPPPDVYTYNPEGRRDPFVSLLFRGSDLRPARESRPDGLPGLLINEVVLRGIVKDKIGYVAMISGPDNKTHIIRGNDKLYDGSVKAITADSVIFSQDVNDPLSLVKQREVRKYLRTTQEAK